MPALRTYRLFISHAWDYNDDYYRLEALLNAAPLFIWANHSVPKHDPLLVNTDASLERKLQDQLTFTHCALFISGMYANHRTWIQKELDLAVHMDKPIIGVRPRGQERIPQAIQDVAREMVYWNTSSIVEAIRRHAL